jgi:hypothetical protein
MFMQDDLYYLSGSINGFGFRADDHGGTPATATALVPSVPSMTGVFTGQGVIERDYDKDYFSFTNYFAEHVSFEVAPAAQGATLDATIELRKSDNTLIDAVDTPSLGEHLELDLPAGDYLIVVKSHGNYGDIGQYSVRGLVISAGNPTWCYKGGSVAMSVADFGPGVTYDWDFDGDGKFGESGADAGNGDEAGKNATYFANSATIGKKTVKLRCYDGSLQSIAATTVDVKAPQVWVSLMDKDASETFFNPGVYRITRAGPVKDSLDVFYEMSGTATNTDDYGTLSGKVTIPAGSSFAEVTIKPVDDLIDEPDETAQLTLKPAGGDVPAYVLGEVTQATVTIQDNDLPAPTRLIATAANGTTTIAATWTDASVDEQGFTVQRSTTPTFQKGTFVESTAAANATSFTSSNLLAGTYYLRVRAFNAAGQSAWSNVASAAVGTTLRIDVGGGGYVDSQGQLWQPDMGSTGGTMSNAPFAVAGTTDDSLYVSQRYGPSFSYNLAALNGNYVLKLYFAEPTKTAAGQRKFDVTAEGALILDDFDLYAEAGAKTSLVKTFSVTITDGYLNLAFLSSVDTAIVSAIELVPA